MVHKNVFLYEKLSFLLIIGLCASFRWEEKKTLFGKKKNVPHIRKRKEWREKGDRSLDGVESCLSFLDGFFAFESASQVADELFVDERVNVLAEEKKDEPVADLAFAGNQFHLIARRQTSLRPQKVHASLGAQYDGETVQEREAADDSQEDEPEPEEDVDLLVDDVERKHAQTVDPLSCSGRTKLVEGALGNFGEYLKEEKQKTMRNC